MGSPYACGLCGDRNPILNAKPYRTWICKRCIQIENEVAHIPTRILANVVKMREQRASEDAAEEAVPGKIDKATAEVIIQDGEARAALRPLFNEVVKEFEEEVGQRLGEGGGVPSPGDIFQILAKFAIKVKAKEGQDDR